MGYTVGEWKLAKGRSIENENLFHMRVAHSFCRANPSVIS